MYSKVTLTALLTLASAAAVLALAPAKPHSAPAKAGAAACFEKLKSFVGDWYRTDDKTKEETLALRFKLTAGGSVLEEIEMPDSSNEMLTMYHMDGSKLVLTHYCAIGNEPHMQATAASKPSKIVFECAGGGNMKSEKDMHMHGLTVYPVDKDHLKTVWTLAQNGKPGQTAIFMVHRKTEDAK